ncbi:hypothetical protein [Mucilaginibacter sp.]|uniref:hypothetical protein n=1 Tax=Mucilaginibacter sp. TaxID=1882438 RepID=UPI00374DFB51
MPDRKTPFLITALKDVIRRIQIKDSRITFLEFNPAKVISENIEEPKLDEQVKPKVNKESGYGKTLGHNGNHFNNLDLYHVKDFFLLLTTRYNKYGQPFLTEVQVDKFIERAFKDNRSIPKVRFNAQDGEYALIQDLFFIFYEICINGFESRPTRGKREKYIKLLTDNFEDFGTESSFKGNFRLKYAGSEPWLIDVNSTIKKYSGNRH